jgi:hypothetical protein
MIATAAQLFKAAYGKFAIGDYNINNADAKFMASRNHLLGSAGQLSAVRASMPVAQN